MFQQFDESNFHSLCDLLAKQDEDLMSILKKYGYPPYWSRPNTVESLVHIILEQQVSLASALSALNKLKEKIKTISPTNIMLMSDMELKACYFSRQKIVYVRALSESIISGQISLSAFESMDDTSIRDQMVCVKGIGNWTIDIYLIFILHHTDVFPAGDLAAVNALKKIKKISMKSGRDAVLSIADTWKPYRTIAVMLLWHYYLEERKKHT